MALAATSNLIAKEIKTADQKISQDAVQCLEEAAPNQQETARKTPAKKLSADTQNVVTANQNLKTAPAVTWAQSFARNVEGDAINWTFTVCYNEAATLDSMSTFDNSEFTINLNGTICTSGMSGFGDGVVQMDGTFFQAEEEMATEKITACNAFSSHLA